MPLVSLRKRKKDWSDHQLVERIAQQNMDAFDEFCVRHHQALTHFLLRIMAKPEVVEEVLNDTFFVVWQKAGTFQQQSKPTTWLYGIAYNKAMKALNRLHRAPENEADEVADTFETDQGLPEKFTEHNQLSQALQQCLILLSPEHRAVIELTYFHGCSCPEIAAIVGCPTNTVKTRMFHARGKLKTLLSEAVAEGSISYD